MPTKKQRGKAPVPQKKPTPKMSKEDKAAAGERTSGAGGSMMPYSKKKK